MGKKRQSNQPQVLCVCSFNLEVEHKIKGSSFLIVDSLGWGWAKRAKTTCEFGMRLSS